MAPATSSWSDISEFVRGIENVDDGEGLICEVKTYEARYNSQGARQPLQVSAKKSFVARGARDLSSALCVTRYYTITKELDYTELVVQSPHIKKAMREVIKAYPGVNMHAGRIVLRDLPKCIFHYRQELQTYGESLSDPIESQHVAFILQYMYQTMRSEVVSYYNLMNSKLDTPSPGLEFENLWMAFLPGSIVYSSARRNEDMAYRLVSMNRCTCPDPFCWKQDWTLEAGNIDCDGDDFGYVVQSLTIRRYDGYKPLHLLDVTPLDHHPEKERIRTALIARGRKFVALFGIHHRWYDGIGKALSPNRRHTLVGEKDEFPLQSLRFRSRLVVDSKGFYIEAPSHKPKFDCEDRQEQDHMPSYLRIPPRKSKFPSEKKLIKTNTGDHLRLTDNELIICNNKVVGFSLLNKRWGFFYVDNVSDVEYNTQAFKSLVLPRETKEMIYSLVKIHATEDLQFDDLIKGKGKGIIFLLHGPPGVGKTLTAESVADGTRRPLYTISSGDLGTDTNLVETRLSYALGLAASWNAVVLIDEADVFLEERKVQDLKRNGLVSVFLRVLEYYEGIMFLTTNRVGVFDTAFKSRIHLAIRYPPLSATSRRELWETFITSGSAENKPEWLDSTHLDKLAGYELNGRQIKNIVRAGFALALSASTELSLKHIAMGLKALKSFDSDFADDTGRNSNDNDQNMTEEQRSKRPRLS